MKALRFARFLVLLSFWTTLTSLSFVSGYLEAAPLSARGGSTGQALALRASLRALVPLAARPRSFQEMGVPTDLRRGSDGRFIYEKPNLTGAAALQPHATAGTTSQVDEAVQTFDVFNPPPGFSPTQGPSLTPTNLTPVWTANETMLVFSSNRTSAGTAGTRFHLWAIAVNGGTPIQLTDSAGLVGGGEFFPALSSGNNQQIAFTSDANSPGVQNLYSLPFSPVKTSIAGLASPTIRTDAFAASQGGTGFSGVARPAFSATNADEIIFSAVSTAGIYTGHAHLFFLFVSTGGFDPANPSLPGKLTDGPADDTDPATSADGQLIAFASTATTLKVNASQTASRFDQSALLTNAPGSARSIFLIGGGSRFGFGVLTNGGLPATAPGTDNFGPAWSSLNRNQFTNPAPGSEYLAFSRGASAASPHDIYYLQVLRNIDSGGETGRSNEAATTPLPALTPVYQVNAGGPAVSGGTNFPNAKYTQDTTPNPASGYYSSGGTADAPNPPPVINTLNDPGTPPQIYQTDRSGTFSYTFTNLTPNANYVVRLHLADPKNNAAGKRVFDVFVNGQQTPGNTPNGDVDIIGGVQSQAGQLIGAVTDSASGSPIAGATIRVQDLNTGLTVTTTPSPLVTTATTIPSPSGAGAAINYQATTLQGSFIVAVLPPAGSGYQAQTQIVNVGSGTFSRADFILAKGTGTPSVGGTVTDSNGAPVAGLSINFTDPTTGAGVNSGVTGAKGGYAVALPPGTYNANITPDPNSGYAAQTVSVTVPPVGTTTGFLIQNFTLTSGAGVGLLGGLLTDSVSGLPVGGATVTVTGTGNALVAVLFTSATTTIPTGGDAAPVNFAANLPVGTYTVQFAASGFAPVTQQVMVVNTPAAGTTLAKSFVRVNKTLVSNAPVQGQNSAIVLSFTASVSSFDQTDPNTGLVTVPAGAIRVNFKPAPNGGDPPIVQGIEILSDSNAGTSSGFGEISNQNNQFFSTTAPSNLSAIGGDLTGTTTGTGTTGTGGTVATGGPLINLSFSAFSGTPSFFNLYRSTGGPGSEGNIPYKVIPYQPGFGGGTFTDTNVTDGTEYYYQVTAVFQEVLTPEGAQPDGTTNAAVKLNTDDNAGQTSAAGNAYDDVYPTWSPFLSVFSIAYSSNRSVTYTDPANGSRASETAISVSRGGSLGGSASVGSSYAGILESQVLNLDAPTLVPYSGNEVLHVADRNGATSRYGLTPGQPVTITARLSSREAGVDDNNVYLQVKDPDSKYQDAQGLEHKVFAKDTEFQTQANNPTRSSLDSGSSAQLMNGGGYSGTNAFGNNNYGQRGSVGGVETNGDSISVGTTPIANQTLGANPVTTNDKGMPLGFDAQGNPITVPGFDPGTFIPWGPEYECQVVNPLYATSGGANAPGDTSGGDYVNPFYLAGVDDQRPFSGFPANGTLQGNVFSQSATTGFGVVTGAVVTVTSATTGQTVTTTPASLVTDANGAFTTPLTPGLYNVTVTLAGFVTTTQQVAISERQVGFVQFTLNAGTGSVTQANPFGFSNGFGSAFTSNGHPPRPTANYTTATTATTTTGTTTTGTTTTTTTGGTTAAQTTTTVAHPAEWLQMKRLPDAQQDGQGGTLYSVTWTPPASGSDYFLDVIAYDKAVFPSFGAGTSSFVGERSNFRIYDNVWGFSTQSSIGSNDILVVSDYALGQKFAATTFGGKNSLVNLVPKFYGAESYLTDVDVNILPNSVYLYAAVAGRQYPIPESLPMAGITPYYNDTSAEGYGDAHVLNGLGVGSYDDSNIDDAGRTDGAPAVASQRYSLWRTLARGPVPVSVLQSYQPNFVTQPAVNDTSVTPAVVVPAGPVPDAHRCVIWMAPFAGDLLVGPGTITDPATQQNLRNFVKAGGRLFMTGQDIGSSLTQVGSANNGPGGFLNDVLGAKLTTPNKGTFVAQGGTSVTENRLSNVAFFDGENRMNFYELQTNGTFTLKNPSQSPILLGNDIGDNIFTTQTGTVNRGGFAVWRTDGSLDQLGPYAQPFAPSSNTFGGVNFDLANSSGTNSVLGQIDTITPIAGGHSDLTLQPFTNTIANSPLGDPNAANSPGGVGLIYRDDPITAAGGTGSRVVYASFGLEALSTEYYTQIVNNNALKNVKFYVPRNQRQNILHNIVCYLRTGTLVGTVNATAGNASPGAGIPGVTVYLISHTGATIPGRGTFSALTDSTGNFKITGVEPGTYTLAAYKNGFTRAVSNATQTFTVEGDATQNASVTLTPQTPGSIAGTVVDTAGNLVPGASVVFNSSDGSQSLPTTTDVNGAYSISNAPVGTYTGVATDPPNFGPSAAQTVTVKSGAASTVNFTLKAGPGSVAGKVVDAVTGLGIGGATVFFSAGSPPAVIAQTTTAADGTYSVGTLAAASYTVTATAPGYGNSAPVQIAVLGGQQASPPDIKLGTAANGTLGGLVTSTGNLTPIAGATLTIVNSGTGQTIQPLPTTTGTATVGPDSAQINYGPVTLPQGNYTVAVTANGVTTATQTVTISVGIFSRLDFTGVNGVAPLHTFSAGLNFLSLPYDYSALGFDGLFGILNTAAPGATPTPNANRSHVALWDPTAANGGAYALDPTPPADAPRLGIGYWVYLKQAVPITQTGAATTGTIAVPLHPAWNQIGVPNLAGIAVSSLTFDMSNGQAPLSFADASSATNHVVSPTLFRFDGKIYQQVSATDTLQPWQAYWIRVFTNTTLRLPTGR